MHLLTPLSGNENESFCRGRWLLPSFVHLSKQNHYYTAARHNFIRRMKLTSENAAAKGKITSLDAIIDLPDVRNAPENLRHLLQADGRIA